jgi:hypothetical protein
MDLGAGPKAPSLCDAGADFMRCNCEQILSARTLLRKEMLLYRAIRRVRAPAAAQQYYLTSRPRIHLADFLVWMNATQDGVHSHESVGQ